MYQIKLLAEIPPVRSNNQYGDELTESIEYIFDIIGDFLGDMECVPPRNEIPDSLYQQTLETILAEFIFHNAEMVHQAVLDYVEFQNGTPF
jgi:hypothetical protein